MYNILKELSNTSSTIKKQEILKGLSKEDTDLFKYMAFLTYDPSIDFYVREFDTSNSEHSDSITLSEGLNDLKNIIASRSITGNNAKQHIEMNHDLLSEENAYVFERVVKRDLKCGVSATTINKVWKNTIYVHPYMRCSGFTEKNLENISYPCYSQTKMDGLYCDIIVHSNEVNIVSRNGLTLNFNTRELDNSLTHKFTNTVLMGEALALNEDGSLMDRSASNGYLNSISVDPERVVFYLWDIVDINSFYNKHDKSRYEDRLNKLQNKLEWINNDKLRLTEFKICHNKDDIIEHFKKKREEGEEGTVIKDKELQWKHGTSKQQIKVKVIFSTDLKVVGWKYATKDSKHDGLLGAIQCESKEGALTVSVGGGYKDTERKQFLDCIDHWVETGMIVEVRGNDVITNKTDPDKWSIFLPRFVKARKDKDGPDSLKQIQEQVASFTNALDVIDKS